MPIVAACQQDDSASIVAAEKEISWLRKAAIPLTSVEDGTDDADLAPLDKMIGGRSVVALGEVTHGASAIYRMKNRIVKHLVAHDSFTVFAIEGNMVQAGRINNYINTGDGDPRELVKDLLHWIWDTQEMLDLVEWMRHYNATHKRKIIFTRFDVQSIKGPIEEIKWIVNKYNRDTTTFNFDTVRDRIHKLDSAKAAVHGIGYIMPPADSNFFADLFDKIEKFAATDITENREREWLTQMAKLLYQRTHKIGAKLRDGFMADNLLWIRKQHPGAKVIVWAHNEHIGISEADRKGDFLKDSLKGDYFTLGFTFHKGIYRAAGKTGADTFVAQTSYPGTAEYRFHNTGAPLLLLSLTNIPRNSTTRWLFDYTPFRSTGMVNIRQEFDHKILIPYFDALLFVNETEATTLLHEHKW